MLCPVCQHNDHRLYDRGGTSTAMSSSPYYENGVYHFHDSNRHGTTYECSNGHLVLVSSRSACPAGDVEAKQEITVKYKHEPCGTWNLRHPDEQCSYCDYRKKRDLREAWQEILQAHRRLPGWQRRRKPFQKFLEEVQAYAAQ